MVNEDRHGWQLAAALACALTGCGAEEAAPAPLALEVTASYADDTRGVIVYDVRTEPGATLELSHGANPGRRFVTRPIGAPSSPEGLARLRLVLPPNVRAEPPTMQVSARLGERRGAVDVPPPVVPVRLVAGDDGNYACEDGVECYVSFIALLGDEAFSIAAPPGTEYVLGEHRGTISEEGRARIAVDPLEALAGFDLATVCADGPIDEVLGEAREVSLTFPNGGGSVRAPFPWTRRHLRSMVDSLLSPALTRRPVERLPEATGDAMWFRGACYGEPHRVSDFLITARVDETRREGTCGRYEHGGSHIEVPRYMTDADVTIFDLRTGRELGRRTFRAAPPACPSVASRGSSVSGRYDQAAVHAWAVSRAR